MISRFLPFRSAFVRLWAGLPAAACLLAVAAMPLQADETFLGAETRVHVSMASDFGTTPSSLEVLESITEEGEDHAAALGTFTDTDSSAEGTISAGFEYDAHSAVATGTFIDPDTDLVMKRIAGGVFFHVAGEGQGSLTAAPWGVADIDAYVSGSVECTFYAPHGFSLDSAGGGGTGFAAGGSHQEETGSFSVSVSGPVSFGHSYPNPQDPDAGDDASFSTTVPGTYTVKVNVSASTRFFHPPFNVLSALDASVKASASFMVSYFVPGTTLVPPPGEYTHPKVGTLLTDSPKLTVASPVILSETPAGGGFTDVRVRAGLSNSSLCPWNGLTLRIAETQPGRPDVEVLDGGTPETDTTLDFDPLPAGATAAPPDPADALTVRVADADLTAFRASVLDGSRFIRHGREQWVFLYPVDLVSGERAERLRNAYVEAARPRPDIDEPGYILFDRVMDVRNGTILLEHEPEYAIPLEHELTAGGLLGAGAAGTYTQGLDSGLPLLVTSVGDGVFGHPDYPSLLHLIKHGTVRDTHIGGHPSGFGITEGFGGPAVAKAHPVHFNRVRIGNAIDLSGSVGIGPGPISIEFEVENAAVKKLLVTASLLANATLLVETRGAADNAGAPLLEQERELFSAPLFTVILPSGLSLTPELSLSVGAAVTVPQGLSVPIQTAMEFTATAGWVDGQPFYDDDLRHEPPAVSPPALFGQLNASVEAWAKTQLRCRLGYGGVGAGPTFGAELRGAFDLEPASDPWWRLHGDLNLTAGVEFDLFGLLTFYDAEKTIKTFEVFDLDAGGPLLPPGPAARSAADPPNPGLRPLAGETTRWARALRLGNTQADPANSYALPIAGTTDFLAGAGHDVNRYRADGEHVWALTYASAAIRDAIGLPDGGFVLVTPGGSVDRYDADGNRLWLSHRGLSGGPTFNINAIAARTGAGGQPEIVIAGWHGQTDGTRAPCVAKFDDTGNVLWSKRYTPDRPDDPSVNTQALDLTVTPDGDIVLCGVTSAMAVGPGAFSNISAVGPDHALVMKLDGENGTFLWSTLLASGRTTSYGQIAADPEGNLYAAGRWGLNVLDDLPVMLISKITGDGALVDTMLIGSAAGEGAEETIYPPSAVPNAGETVFDTIHDLVWANGSLWAAGQIGAGNFPAGLSKAQDAFTMRLTKNLAVDRFALHGGTAGEVFGAIADGGDGLLAVGHSYSFLPWPTGAGPQGTTPGTQNCRLVAKLPWEGLLRFHDLSTGVQPSRNDPDPNRGAHYIYPRVVAASDVTAFGGYVANTGTTWWFDEPVRVLSSGLPFTVSDLPLSDLPFPPLALADTTPLDHYQIEFVPRQAIDSFDTFLRWHQMDETDDTDADGMNLATEFYHGTDAAVPDTVVPRFSLTEDGMASLTVPRSKLANGIDPVVQDSSDLQEWFFRTDLQLQSRPLNASQDLLQILLPIDETHDRRFYRLAPPEH